MGRYDVGVVVQGLHALILGLRRSKVLFGSGHGGLGGVDLRFGGEVAGLGVIEFLLRDQAGVALRCLLQARVLFMQSLVLRFGAIDLVLRARNLFLALVDLEDGLLQLRLQFRNFKRSERLALLDDVADVDVDLAHVAADLGVDVDHLVGLELPGEREHVADVAPLRNCYASGGNRRRLSRFRGLRPASGRR